MARGLSSTASIMNMWRDHGKEKRMVTLDLTRENTT